MMTLTQRPHFLPSFALGEPALTDGTMAKSQNLFNLLQNIIKTSLLGLICPLLGLMAMVQSTQQFPRFCVGTSDIYISIF